MGDEHFDAVVVGSGFGGSVTAFRLAEAGHAGLRPRARARRTRPGRSRAARWPSRRSLWDPSEGLHGLFNVWEFSGLGGIVASGLGGGSLLYSNILLRKDRSTFVQEDLDAGGWESWPVTYDDLEPHYERHETMLQGDAVSDGARPVRRDAEDGRAPEAADALGLEWLLPKLAITFAPDGGRARARRADPRRGAEPARPHAPDLPALRRVQLRLQLRLEVHARLQLPLVREAQARRRHPHAVRGEDVRPAAGGRLRDPLRRPLGGRRGRAGRSARPPEHTLTADRLVLAAGTFGSTYLLLKNRASFPGLSERLGRASAATATCSPSRSGRTRPSTASGAGARSSPATGR